MAGDPASIDSLDAAPDRRHGSNGRMRTEAFSSQNGALVALDHRFGSSWSAGSLRACLGFALVYCWIAYFLSWGLGGSGRLGSIQPLADPDQPARLIGALCAIAFPLVAMVIGRTLGRVERRLKIKFVRWRRRKPSQYRTRLRLADFERHYRWLLGLVFGAALITVLIWFQRGDVTAFTILFSWLALGPVSGIAVARRFTHPTSQGVAALIAGFGSIAGGMLLILAFAGAGVSAFAFAVLGVTNIAFMGALGVLLEVVMGGVFTLGLALAGAGVATVALALAGAGTGIATLTGIATMSRAGLAAFILLMSGATIATLAFEEAAVLSAVIGGMSALAVAAAVSHNRMGRHGAYAGAVGAIALLTLAAVLFGWGDRPLVMFAVCFFFLLPFLLGLTGWISLAVMRGLLERTIAKGSGWLMVFLTIMTIWAIGAASMATLAFLLGYGAEGYNQLAFARSGAFAFDVESTILRAIGDPFGEGFWLAALLLTPFIAPAVFTAGFFTDVLLALQPYDYRLRRPLFRALGVTLTSVLVIAAIGLVSAGANINPAHTLGALAFDGLDEATNAFGQPTTK